ncbi:WbuC family cupin fold metalloprotein [Saccharicrinis sp. GN24d3]|uniref:WbuC family cupin fold metalloprotein n=1 Tax=Saccharicrinis sp. GN24d3 TaxID=3458416 RepID=UPI004035AAA2
MKLINAEHLETLTEQAQNSERKRKNYNFHDRDGDLVQRMLNAFEPNTYVRPHRHVNPDKREVFLILTGRLLVIFFNDEGEITDHAILDRETGQYGVEISSSEWHSTTGLEEGTVVYEIKDGPYYQSEDKNFAPWSPPEGSTEAHTYLKACLTYLNISV